MNTVINQNCYKGLTLEVSR